LEGTTSSLAQATWRLLRIAVNIVNDDALALRRHLVLDVARQGTARAEQVDLEDHRVDVVVLIEQMLERRVGDDAAVPEVIRSDFTIGRAGDRVPLAITCSGSIMSVALSKYMKLSFSTLTAPTASLVSFSLISEKLTSSSRVSRNAALS